MGTLFAHPARSCNISMGIFYLLKDEHAAFLALKTKGATKNLLWKK